MAIAAETKVRDPVCGMAINPTQATGHSGYDGATYSFCSNSCKSRFDADPTQYVVAGEQVPTQAVEAAPEAAPALLAK